MAISPPNTGNSDLNGYLANLQALVDILDSKSIPEEGWSLSDLSAEVSETISDKRDIIDVANTAVAKLEEVRELASDLRAFSMGLEDARDFKAAAEGLLDWYDQNEISIQALLEMTSGSNGAADLIESFDLIRAAVETSATNAKASETAAKASQTAAKTSETNAATSRTNAASSATAAAGSATAAGNSATAAKTSETNAKTSETNAKASETAAAASETAAASSASSASSSKTAAAGSATAAGNSATAAKTSETNAKTSETNAKASETAAAASETAAKASQTAAKTSETNAATSRTNAASSATAAKTSETNAANSATAAADSATQADNIVNTTSWSGDKVTINGKTSPSLTGPVGPAPALQAGTAKKLDPGASPTLSLSGEGGSYSLEVGVPVGERGLPGQVGITNSTSGVTSYDPVVIDLKPYLVEGVTAARFTLTVAGSTATLTAYDVKNSNSGALIFPASALPAEYRPKADLAGPCFIREGSATTTTNSAFWTVSTAGTMSHWRSGSGANGYGWVATWSVAAPVLHANTASILDGAVTPEKLSQAYATPGYVDSQVSSRTLPDTVSTMISSAISGLVGSAPAALDTVYELAAYLTDSTVANGIVQQLAGKANTSHTHTSAQISNATNLATASTVIRRDASGMFNVNTPTAAAHPASKGYVDGQTWTSAQISDATATATANRVVIRDASGTFSVGTPTVTTHPTPKSYVDSGLSNVYTEVYKRPALFSGAGNPPSSIPGAVVGDYWLNETTMQLRKITGV